MSVSSQEELHLRLYGLEPLISRGLAVESGPAGDVLILRNGHVYGVWRSKDGGFDYIPGGYNEPTYRALSVDEAAMYTVQHFERRRQN